MTRTVSNASIVVCHLLKQLVNPDYKIDGTLLRAVDWEEVRKLAQKQGVQAIILDVLSTMPAELRPNSGPFLMSWIGESISIENLYEQHTNVISDLSAFYERHGMKMLLLKGWGLSLNYPKPSHRPCGDVDIWLYGNQKKADALIEKEKDIHPVKSSHHTIFFYQNVEVENHITFIEVDCHKADGSEDILLEYAKEPTLEVDGARNIKVHLPSANLNAFFLLRHSSAHFVTEGITLRHILDWGFFVERFHDQIEWDTIYRQAKTINMHIFLDCQNAICVYKLGFSALHFPVRKRHPKLEKRIFSDIIQPEFTNVAPSMRANFLKYCYVKTKRQFANKWKYDITYNESFWSIMLRFAWNRIKSPYSFADILEKKDKKR